MKQLPITQAYNDEVDVDITVEQTIFCPGAAPPAASFRIPRTELLPGIDIDTLADVACRQGLAGTEHLLLVEDDRVMAQLSKYLFCSLGYRVTHCNTTDMALAVFEMAPQDVDLVVTSFRMPHLDGLELCIRVLEQRRELPVLLLGSGYMRELPDLARLLGVSGFLQRPLRVEEFVLTVRTLLDSPADQIAFPMKEKGGVR